MTKQTWWRLPRGWVIIGMGLMLVFLSAVAVCKHRNLLTSQFDMGNMEQVVWNTLHGHFFQLTSPIEATHQSRAAIHADFLLLIYVPFYALWSSPVVMMLVQAVAVVSGAWALFHFARRRVGDRLGAWLSLSYLVYPSLLWATIFDVHAVVLAAPLMLWAIWAIDRRRWWVYGFSIAGLLVAKEEVGVTVALLGLFIAWRYRPRWVGFLTSAVGITWTVVMLEVVIPGARHMAGHFALQYYADYGGSIGQVAGHLLTHPWELLAKMFTRHGLGYQAALLFPTGGLALIGLPFLMIGTPELAINLLSNNQNLGTIFFQYTSVLIPIVLISAVYGLQSVQWFLRRWPRWTTFLTAGVIVVQLFGIYWWAPLPGLHRGGNALDPFRPSSYRASMAALKKLVKPTDKVAATNNAAAQFTAREYEWAFPNDLAHADVAIDWPTGQFDLVTADRLKAIAQDMNRDPQWTLIYHDRDLYAWRRVARPD